VIAKFTGLHFAGFELNPDWSSFGVAGMHTIAKSLIIFLAMPFGENFSLNNLVSRSTMVNRFAGKFLTALWALEITVGMVF
jgi:hypothetical protein